MVEPKSRCRKCCGEMLPSRAIVEGVSGLSDFLVGEIVTMSGDGSCIEIACLKCRECGWSVK